MKATNMKKEKSLTDTQNITFEIHKKNYLFQIKNEPISQKRSHITNRFKRDYGINFSDILKAENKARKDEEKMLAEFNIPVSSFRHIPRTQLERENKELKQQLAKLKK